MENENRKINKCIMQGWTGICMVLFLAYMLEVVKGNRTSLYFAIFSILTVGPVIFSWIAYKKVDVSNIFVQGFMVCSMCLF